MRLFIAVDLPPADRAVLAALPRPDWHAGWTPAQRLHLTLRFIGEVDVETEDRIATALDGIRSSAFTLEGSGLGVFPSPRRARVLYASIVPTAGLLALHQRIEQALQSIGIDAETRPFRPHVTLARFKRRAPEGIRAYLNDHRDLTLGPARIAAFSLYESRLRADGAQHLVRARFPLRHTLD